MLPGPNVLRAIEQKMEQHEIQIGDARFWERGDIANVFHATTQAIPKELGCEGRRVISFHRESQPSSLLPRDRHAVF